MIGDGLRLFPRSALIIVILAGSATADTRSSGPQNDVFDAPALVVLSDADMVASAYADGKLGPAAGSDAMTVLTFDRTHAAPASRATLAVSNSVTGPPAPMAMTPDGRYAIVVETRGPRPPSGEDVGLANLSLARGITVVDLQDPVHPAVVQRLEGPRVAGTVSVSPDGRLVAIAVLPNGDGGPTPLWIYRFASGRLTDGKAVQIPGWASGDELDGATFDPHDIRLALLNGTARTLSLFDVISTPGSVSLQPWGDAVPIESTPMVAKFSPDGHYVFVNAYYAGGPMPPPPYNFPAGTITAIRLDADRDAHGKPLHLVIDHEMVGRGPEGMAISPDGELVVSVDMEGSYFPASDPRRTRYSTLTLFRFDKATGVLHRAGSYQFDGVLPESAIFDKTSRRLAVSSFGEFDDPTAPGSVDIWRVVADPLDPARISLVETRHSITVPRGAMQLDIAGSR